MRENSRFECLANIRCKKENRAYSIKMVVLFQKLSEISDFRELFLFLVYCGAMGEGTNQLSKSMHGSVKIYAQNYLQARLSEVSRQ